MTNGAGTLILSSLGYKAASAASYTRALCIRGQWVVDNMLQYLAIEKDKGSLHTHLFSLEGRGTVRVNWFC